MEIVGAVFADFERAPAGGPSQLHTELGGRTVLAHTLRRLVRMAGLARRCLFVRPADEAVGREALQAAGVEDAVELLAIDDVPRPRRTLLAAGRKWNLDAWRGGLLGTTWFDEYVEPRAVLRIMQHYRCEAVMCIEGHQPLLDPQIGGEMIRHLRAYAHNAHCTFTQAPPGVAGIIIRGQWLKRLLDYEIPVGLLLTYRPEMPQFDPIILDMCYHVPQEVAQTAGRLTGDTRRSRELLAGVFADLGEDASAVDACRWLREPGRERAGPLPVEIELELTTDDPLPTTMLRPRGTRVPRRALEDMDVVRAMAGQLGEYDDRLVYVGGHGDPLRCSRWVEVCQILREAGVHGIALATTLLDADEATIQALFSIPVDVLEVRIDAHTAETYRKVQGVDGFERVMATMQRIEEHRRQHAAPQPILVPSLTRCTATIEEMEGFFDAWIKQVGSAVIRGYSTYGGLMPADGLLSTTPDEREACRQLGGRLMLLADGTAVACNQDVDGQLVVGDWRRESLREIWGGQRLGDIRRAHAAGRWDELAVCPACEQWIRV